MRELTAFLDVATPVASPPSSGKLPAAPRAAQAFRRVRTSDSLGPARRLLLQYCPLPRPEMGPSRANTRMRSSAHLMHLVAEARDAVAEAQADNVARTSRLDASVSRSRSFSLEDDAEGRRAKAARPAGAPVMTWESWVEAAAAVLARQAAGETVAPKDVTDLLDEVLQLALPEAKEDARHMVQLKAQLGESAKELAASARLEMLELIQSDDYSAVRGLLLEHERMAEVDEETRLQWVDLHQRKEEMLDEVRAELREMAEEGTDLAATEAELAELADFEEDARDDFETVRREVQRREDGARWELQKVLRDSSATINDLSASVDKWGGCEAVTSERAAVQKRLSAAVESAKAEIVAATAGDAITAVDACLQQYAASSDSKLAEELTALEQRGEDLRDEMWEQLTQASDSETPPHAMVLAKMVERAETFGSELSGPRRAVERRLDAIIAAAQAELRKLALISDYGLIRRTQERYKGWPSGTDAALQQLEQRRVWLLGEANKALKSAGYSTNITLLHGVLEKHADYEPDCPLFAEIRRRHDKALAEAIAEMESTRLDQTVDIKGLERVLAHYDGVPGTADARKALGQRLSVVAGAAEAEMMEACGLQRLAAVDAVLNKFTELGGPKLRASAAMDSLRHHRAQLCAQMREQLRAGMSLENAPDLGRLLLSSEEYEADFPSERKTLRQRRAKLAKMSTETMQKMSTSKDFTAVCATLEHYRECAPEAERAREALEQHKTKLMERANNTLKRACGQDLPAMEAALVKCASFEDACAESIRVLRARRDETIEAIRSELHACATLVDLHAWDGRYGKFQTIPDIVADMRARFAALVVDVTRECQASAETKDFVAVEAALTKHEPWAQFIDGQYKDLRRLRVQLVTSMGRALQQATSGDDPSAIVEAIEESTDFGSSVDKPRQKAKAKHRKLVENATKVMGKACRSKRYVQVVETIDTFRGYSEQTDADWRTLCAHRDGLVADAKRAVSDLAAAATPAEIDDVLAVYAEYGDSVDAERAAAKMRRAELVNSAVQEIRSVLRSAEGESQDSILAMLAKFDAAGYPDSDLKDQRDALKCKLSLLSATTAKQIKAALRCRELHPVDECIGRCEKLQLDTATGALLERLCTHRSRLVANTVEQLRKLLESRCPHELAHGISAAEPFCASPEVAQIRAEVDAHRSKLLADCTAALRGVVGAKPAALEQATVDYATFQAVPECHEAFVEVETSLAAHYADFRAGVQELLDQADPHPGQIKALLLKAADYGPGVAADVESLTVLFKKSVRKGNAELSALARSGNFVQVEAALQLYAEHPAEFDQGRSSLRQRSKCLVDNAKQEVAVLCKRAACPQDISDGMRAYDSFGDKLRSEQQAATERVAELIRLAREDMDQCSKQTGASLFAMQATLDKYAEYPSELDDVRSALGTAITTTAAQESSRLIVLCDSQDIARIDEVLGIAESLQTLKMLLSLRHAPFRLVADAYAALQHHRAELEDSARKSARAALAATTPTELDAAVQATMVFGAALEPERDAIRTRRKKLIKDARTAMSKVDVDDFNKVEAACFEFGGFSADTDSEWSSLVQRRKELLESAQQRLRHAAMSTDPLEVEQIMRQCEPYAAAVESELEIVESHAKKLCDDICAAIKAAVQQYGQGKAVLAELESTADRYEYLAAHGPVEAEYQSLVDAFAKGLSDLEAVVAQAQTSDDVVECDGLYQRYSAGDCRAAQELVASLKAHRDHLVSEYRVKITKAVAFKTDPDEVQKLHCEVLPLKKYIGSKEVKQLEQHRDELITTKVGELTQLLESQDFLAVTVALDESEDLRSQSAIKGSFDRLSQHRDQLIAAAKARLGELRNEEDPNTIDSVIAGYDAYGASVEAERASAIQQRNSLVSVARQQMTPPEDSPGSMTNHALTYRVKDLVAVEARYTHYPDVERARKNLQKRISSLFGEADKRLNAKLSSLDFEEVESTLRDFVEIQPDVGESFGLLHAHLERLYTWDEEKWSGSDTASMQPEEQTTLVHVKISRQLDSSARKALTEAYAADQKSKSQELFREDHGTKVLRELQRHSKRPKKERPKNQLIRAGRRTQQEKTDFMFKGGTGFYTPSFDYSQLEWTMEDELAARFSKEDGSGEEMQRPISVEMSIAMDFDSVNGNPATRQQFEESFIADMAKTLGCDPSLIVVDGLKKGSVIVKFTLKPAAGGGPSPVALGAKLNGMIQDPQSALTKSTLLQKVNRSRGLLVAAKPLPPQRQVQSVPRGPTVDPAEFSLEVYCAKWRAETKLVRMQLAENNRPLDLRLAKVAADFKPVEDEHEALYNQLMEMHNHLMRLENPNLFQDLQKEKAQLTDRLARRLDAIPKLVVRAGVANASGTGSVVDSRVPLPPHGRPKSAPSKRASKLHDGAISRPIKDIVLISEGSREHEAASMIQRMHRGKHARKAFERRLDQARAEANHRKELAAAHDLDPSQLPSKPEIAEAAKEIGLDVAEQADAEFLWLAEEYLLAPLPPGWSEMFLPRYRCVMYVSNEGQTEWAHPSNKYYSGLVQELHRLRREYDFVAAKKGGLFKVAAIGARVDSLLKGHAEEQQRQLHREANELAGNEWAEVGALVDGDHAGAHLSRTGQKTLKRKVAYDPRRVLKQKIKDKRAEREVLSKLEDSTSQLLLTRLDAEIASLVEELAEHHSANDRRERRASQLLSADGSAASIASSLSSAGPPPDLPTLPFATPPSSAPSSTSKKGPRRRRSSTVMVRTRTAVHMEAMY